jgi:inosine-uridine nucleoside N-ribohydrolase
MRIRKFAARAFIVLSGMALLAAATLALPIEAWRTGRSEVEQLSLAPAGAHAVDGRRVWVDTDAACGAGRMTDPDDCLALLALLKAQGLEVVGVSTVFGNGPLEVTDRTTRGLISRLAAEGFPVPPVHRGRATAAGADEDGATPAEQAIRDALADGPMVIVALGPLTNIAAALRRHPDLAPRIQRIVAVMGQRRSHVFHPVEGGTAAMLFGHGPVFQDFNFVKDPMAAAELISLGLPMTLIPYEAASEVALTGADLDAMGRAGGAARWAAERSRGWLAFWRADIRQPGFFPFDLVAAAYLLHPELFRCAEVSPSIEPHSWFWRWRLGASGLFVEQSPEDGEHGPLQRIVYCPSPRAGLHDAILADLRFGSRQAQPARRARGGSSSRTGRTSMLPVDASGIFAASRSASSRSVASIRMKPSSCSLVSANGPSVTSVSRFRTRTVFAVSTSWRASETR